ncbi:MAG: glutamine--fructose-6-phosphate transaminase (isomerizing) [Patescibacteria group bacterium]|nr:glutamine--fructose-6-phosphate transaminase (isomerizing) [Patescibacteria group bacterium]MDD5294553.1 glutamine--fructose-6-phosphate transaminase (isomerizing) [Patescibacteria group bacterium]MDD5554650.1 glutamine--fructose-6-phosphate transaminase (isomerizing) [Patescibacteria group bacterium]
MCGIIGYIGPRDISSVLLTGLKRLEYRGYDSAGMTINNPDGLATFKAVGKIMELEKKISGRDLAGNLGIAHTRWATHGEPNEINAHPHLDAKGEVAIVHNGIIENYYALKDFLIKEGFKIVSDTDSEIVAHLIQKFHNGDFSESVAKALELIEGTFGLAIVQKGENKIIAARRGSPLVLGLGEGEMFIASDVSAVLDYTKRIIYLNDDELAIVEKDSYSVKNLKGEEVNKKVHEIKWTLDQIEKKGFKHFMLKEIFEQPEAIINTLRGRIKEGKIKLSLDLNMNSLKRIIIVACGTSWHSALIGKHLLEKIAGVPVEVDYASEFRYRDPLIREGDLVIVISQSGETADTLAALREAKARGAKILGIVNVVGSTISREVDSGIYLHAGPEIGVASTKAFTVQVVDLLLLALFLRQEKGLDLQKDIIRNLETLPEKIREALGQSDSIRELAEKFVNCKNILYLGRGLNFPVALEGALKLKEISYIHAEGYPAAEMKHGPIALIDKDMPALFIATRDNTYEKILSNMEEIKARGGEIIAVVNEDDKKVIGLAGSIIKVPSVSCELTPVVNAIPMQLFAYHVADLRGIDMDKPRNLAKSVTVE